jgi:hypothetical protein
MAPALKLQLRPSTSSNAPESRTNNHLEVINIGQADEGGSISDRSISKKERDIIEITKLIQ